MRVVISQVKAVPSAGFGFVPRCIPWEVTLVQDPTTGTIQHRINISAQANYLHGYPTADGTVTFFPASSTLNDSPVPVLVIAAVFAGALEEQHVLKEIITETDWAWLADTHGVTKAHLGLA